LPRGKRQSKIIMPVSMEPQAPVYSKHREDEFVAKGHLTKHLTGDQYNIIIERSRINSWEELDYVTWKKLLADDLDVELYKKTTEIHLGCKISKDGESRKEDVDAIYGLQNEYEDGKKATGLRRATQAILERRQSHESPR
jgi:hypothetical protein